MSHGRRVFYCQIKGCKNWALQSHSSSQSCAMETETSVAMETETRMKRSSDFCLKKFCCTKWSCDSLLLLDQENTLFRVTYIIFQNVI